MLNLKNTPNYLPVIQRGLALIIDLYLLWIGFGYFYDYLNRDSLMGEGAMFVGVFELLMYLPFVMVYGLICESVSGGYTIGKFICRVRVRKEDGSSAGVTEAFKRWLSGLIDFYLTLGLGALISLLLSSGQKRIGDRWAKTVVR